MFFVFFQGKSTSRLTTHWQMRSLKRQHAWPLVSADWMQPTTTRPFRAKVQLFESQGTLFSTKWLLYHLISVKMVSSHKSHKRKMIPKTTNKQLQTVFVILKLMILKKYYTRMNQNRNLQLEKVIQIIFPENNEIIWTETWTNPIIRKWKGTI